MIREIRLPREIAALWVLHQHLRGKGRILRVRYTRAELVCIYHAPKPA